MRLLGDSWEGGVAGEGGGKVGEVHSRQEIGVLKNIHKQHTKTK